MIQNLALAILILFLISRPIHFRMTAKLDLEKAEAEAFFFLSFIKLYTAKGLLENLTLSGSDFIVYLKNKKKNVHMEFKKRTINLVFQKLKTIDLSFLGNLDVKNVTISIHYGHKDALTTTLAIAAARIVFYSLLSVLKSYQPVDVTEEFTPVYNKKELKLDFESIFCLSFADIIFGYLWGKIKKLRPKRHKHQAQPA